MRCLRFQPNSSLLFPTQRRHISDHRAFAIGDLAILRQKLDRSAPPILTRPLQAGKTIESHRGVIHHNDIIGKRVRDVVRSTTTARSNKLGTEYRLHGVTLEEYVRLSKRLVTPIYPSDANLIVNLLDLHPDSVGADETDQACLEILEAGTGHGALTLHLSRAIHAANSDPAQRQRRAVVHSVDVSPHFSAHARSVVSGFRNGLYARNVDFHVGDVSEKLSALQVERGREPFLSHAFLDLPAAEAHLSSVAAALRTDATLVVFNPSITQIIECASRVKNERIPLDLENVVELGVNGGSAGREWDVRFVRPRIANAQQGAVQVESEPAEGVSADAEEVQAPSADGKWSLVCRPKVGVRITGGGFLGVWKKERDMRARA